MRHLFCPFGACVRWDSRSIRRRKYQAHVRLDRNSIGQMHPQYATKRPLSGAVVGKTFAILKYRKGGHQGRPTVANRTSRSPSLRIGVRIARLGCSRLIRFPLLIRGILTSLGRRGRARRPAACTDGPGLEPNRSGRRSGLLETSSRLPVAPEAFHRRTTPPYH